jgi:trans-aconitate 2-methyltransferase
MVDWNPSQYLAFANERSLPIIDLINRLPLSRPRVVVDLGCGPGNSTAFLRKAFPDARLYGLDKSPAMITKAKTVLPDVSFDVCDAAQWKQDKTSDLIFSNALMQWLPDHVKLLQRLVQGLKPGALLAVQMPDNLNEPTHLAMGEVADLTVWRDKLKLVNQLRATVLDAEQYYDALKPFCETIDVWRTTYFHSVAGLEGIFDFFQSTGLKPYLDRLSDPERESFRTQYVRIISGHYGVLHDRKVLFGLPRLFIVLKK